MRGMYCLLICLLVSCEGGFQEIDQRVDAMMARTSAGMNADQPALQAEDLDAPSKSVVDPTPQTVNPQVNSLSYIPAGDFDVEGVAGSLDRAAEELEASSVVLTLQDAFAVVEYTCQRNEIRRI